MMIYLVGFINVTYLQNVVNHQFPISNSNPRNRQLSTVLWLPLSYLREPLYLVRYLPLCAHSKHTSNAIFNPILKVSFLRYLASWLALFNAGNLDL